MTWGARLGRGAVRVLELLCINVGVVAVVVALIYIGEGLS